MTGNLAHPPAWAALLLTLFAPARRQDSVVGDLLEEYRDAQLPQFGRAAADRWFAGHALGFLWRVAMPWAFVFGLLLAARDVIDLTIATTDNFHFRAAVTTYLAMGTYATAGLVTGWRCGRVVAGTAVSLVMTAVASGISIVEALIVYALLSAGVFHAATTYGGLSEATDIPLVPMLLIGVPLSCIGAGIGKAGRLRQRANVA